MTAQGPRPGSMASKARATQWATVVFPLVSGNPDDLHSRGGRTVEPVGGPGR